MLFLFKKEKIVKLCSKCGQPSHVAAHCVKSKVSGSFFPTSNYLFYFQSPMRPQVCDRSGLQFSGSLMNLPITNQTNMHSLQPLQPSIQEGFIQSHEWTH